MQQQAHQTRTVLPALPMGNSLPPRSQRTNQREAKVEKIPLHLLSECAPFLVNGLPKRPTKAFTEQPLPTRSLAREQPQPCLSGINRSRLPPYMVCIESGPFKLIPPYLAFTLLRNPCSAHHPTPVHQMEIGFHDEYSSWRSGSSPDSKMGVRFPNPSTPLVRVSSGKVSTYRIA